MPVSLTLTFVSTFAFAIQLLIFAYLYSSHRLRFFQYLLLAWGAYTLSKGLKVADGFMLAAGLAFRWNYRLRGRDLLVGAALALVLALASDMGGGDEGMHLIG